MLIVPAKDQERIEREKHETAKEGLVAHFNQEMERILNENSHKEEYFILGKARFPEEYGGMVGRTFLEATDTQPPFVKDAFLYHVDNKRGCKTILWVSHPDGTLRLPTLNKTLHIDNTKQQASPATWAQHL